MIEKYEADVGYVLVHVVLEGFVVHLQVPALLFLHEFKAFQQLAHNCVESVADCGLHEVAGIVFEAPFLRDLSK